MTLSRIVDAQKWRAESYKRFMRMYSSQPMTGFGIGVDQTPFAPKSTLGINITKSCVDTFAATLTKEKPKTTFLTSGGDWELQKKARDAQKFISGQFYESHIYNKNSLFAIHCGITGVGIYKPWIRWKTPDKMPSIEVDLVHCMEVHVDDQEGANGHPRNFYQTKWVDREVIIATYPEKEAEIRAAQRVSDKKIASIDLNTTSDQLLVLECWHLSPNGKRIVCIYNGPMLEETDYESERSPFIIFRRSPAPIGFWGIGLAKELEGIQYEINTLLQKIQRAHKLLGGGHWVAESSSKIRGEHIDDVIGSLIRYTGIAPTFYSPGMIQPEIYQHLWALVKQAYEITGISQLQSSAQKPAGLNSGEAQRVYLEAINVRGQIAQDNFQACHLELAEHILEHAKTISKKYPDFSARAVAGRSMKRVRFLDATMKDNEYVLQMYPTSALADDPAMRMSQVQELAQAGWIGEDDAKRLLDFPDLESWKNATNASYELVEDIIEGILYDDEYRAPVPFLDLAGAILQFKMAYLQAMRKRAPEPKLSQLRTWMIQARDMLKGGNVNDVTPPAPPGAPPPMMSNSSSPLSPAGPPPMPPGGMPHAA